MREIKNIQQVDNLDARGRSLTLETDLIEENGAILSILSEGGRVLAKEVEYLSENQALLNIPERVRLFHNERKDTIEMLYHITARVHTVRHAPSLIRLGRQFLRWKLLDEAISEFELAIHYDNQDVEAYVGLVKAYMDRGSIEEAIALLLEAEKKKPDSPELNYWNGRALMKNGRFNEAILALQTIKRLNPLHDNALLVWALCLLKKVNENSSSLDIDGTPCIEKAKELLAKIITESTRFNTAGIDEVIRNVHHDKLEIAIDLAEEILQTMPSDIDLSFDDVFYLGLMYGEKGKDGGTVQSYMSQLERLIKMHPDNPNLRDKLGIGYLVLSRHLYGQALNSFRDASRMDPENEKWKSHLKLVRNEGKGIVLLLRAMLK